MRLARAVCIVLFSANSCTAPRYASLRERAALEGMCNDAPAQHLVGQNATTQTAVAVIRASNARYFEWIAPDSIVTTAFSPWRVRVTYDRTLTVTEIRFG